MYNIWTHVYKQCTQKYEEEWEKAKTATSESVQVQADFDAAIETDLEIIRTECENANATLKIGHEKLISAAGLMTRVPYWIGAAGVGRLSRKGKIRQATMNIDDLFAEVCHLIVIPSPSFSRADTGALSGRNRE